MNGIWILLTLAAPGVDYNWNTTPQGVEYVIDIEPDLIQPMVEGREVESLVPPKVEGIRSVRIHVGKANQGKGPGTIQDVDYGWQPLDGGGVDFFVQIRPTAIRQLQNGENITVTIPDQVTRVTDVSRFRVFVGTEQLPQEPLYAAAPTGGLAPVAPVANEAPAAGRPNVANYQAGDPGATGYAAPPAGYRPPAPTTGYQGQTGGYQPTTPDPVGYPGAAPAYDPPGYTGQGAGYPYPDNYTADARSPRSGVATGGAPGTGVFDRMRPGQGVTNTGASSSAPTAAPSIPRNDGGQTNVTMRPTTTSGEAPKTTSSLLTPLITLLLFASLGGNFYLFWVIIGLSDRYRNALADLRDQSRRAARTA